MTWARAPAIAGSPALGVSAMTPAQPASAKPRTTASWPVAPPKAWSAARTSDQVDGSATPGPEPITLRSSPTTSEIASVTTWPRQLAASRPPLTADRCLRTAFSSVIAAPAAIIVRAVCCLSASDRPGVGAAISAEAPPDSSTSSRPPGGTAAAISSAARPPSRLPSVANGCPPVTQRPPPQCAGRWGPIASDDPRRPGAAAAKAAYIAAAALPTAMTSRGPGRAITSPATPARARGTSVRGDTAATAAVRTANASLRRRPSAGLS